MKNNSYKLTVSGSTCCGQDRPLNEEEVSIIDTNLSFLRSHIDPTDLIVRLMADDVITPLHREKIDSYHTDWEKAGELLKIITKRSCAAFVQFIKSLKGTNQTHIAKILEDGGGKSNFIAISFFYKCDQPWQTMLSFKRDSLLFKCGMN